jgi:hypothetical protein
MSHFSDASHETAQTTAVAAKDRRVVERSLCVLKCDGQSFALSANGFEGRRVCTGWRRCAHLCSPILVQSHRIAVRSAGAQ